MQSRPDTRFAPAAEFGRSELTALWNRAYENYFVPIAFTEPLFERHLRRASADLDLSRLLLIGDALHGISLVGRRQERAYLAGFGIAGAQRGRGLARALLEAQISALSDAGMREIVLEVIEQNPARMLYRKAGFAEIRPLVVLEGTLAQGRASAGMALDAAALASAHALCNADTRPTWRREIPTVLGAVATEGAVALGVQRDAAIVGYAVYLEGSENSALLDAGALDEAAASDLLDALACARVGTTWRLVDEPPDSALFRAVTARGLATGIRQVEMQLAL
ncbi:GNAT family N-acetyltransferase [Variovorax sp. LjRoot290]|uniref:GNAT family N-acetyltransferase n=1 Tax=unclassified Variovorax TaxID=663243 RepID=UPI003ECD7196